MNIMQSPNTGVGKNLSSNKCCECGNPEYGFDCVCEFVEKNPGKNNYCCEWCGIYTAGVQRCNKCEKD